MSDQLVPEDLEDLYENAPCGYLSLSPKGRIVKFNGTFCRWTGLRPEDLLEKRLRDLLNVSGAIFYETHFAPLLRMQGFFDEVALDIIKADGELLPVLANAAEKRTEAGDVLFTRVTVFRAHERRRYERELVNAQETERAARLQLEKANAALQADAELREQFIAVLGHDLRNPLAAVDAGLGQLLKRGFSERTPTILQLMQRSVSRMSGLIENILDLARTQHGDGMVLHIEHGRPLEPTLTQVIDEQQAAWPEREFSVDIRIDHNPPVDHVRLAQLVSNLLGNAVTHGAQDLPIRIQAAGNQEILEVSVSNGGKPIPAEMIGELFKPFRRGSVKSNAKGLGLGLYIANQIAEAHCGRIDVMSDATETRFTFSMSTIDRSSNNTRDYDD
ncbi:PAS domain-containing sensor histidine kinase [Devosia sp. BSSL-BM10]|uniref:histidine kinase n=1 Tax=Devosia litorisediminis TaxID=2829817 RepID=A0A942E5X5_9HYPH|nr:PAS domain-containing sensor histidine kinase [Devosia litorisediminis]MBS3848066.1 PAS domain-containing sensor histidine kinase [Devosia litorisediminis]